MLCILSLEHVQFWKKHPAVSFLCPDDSYIVYDKIVTKSISVSKLTTAPITYKENQMIPIQEQVKLNRII